MSCPGACSPRDLRRRVAPHERRARRPGRRRRRAKGPSRRRDRARRGGPRLAHRRRSFRGSPRDRRRRGRLPRHRGSRRRDRLLLLLLLLLLRDRRLLLRLTRRKERQRIQIAVRLGGEADAEIDVRLGAFGIAARPDRSDDVAFRDVRPDGNADRSEMDERDRVTVRRADRQAQPLMRELPSERDDARCGRPDIRTSRRADVDSAVLPTCVRIAVGDERSQHGPVDWPGPRGSPGSQHEHREQQQDQCVA